MAAIDLQYTKQTTEQSTTNSSYTTVLTLAGTNLVGNATYLLIVNAQVGGNNTNTLFGFQVFAGGSGITESEHYQEPAGAGPSRKNPYFFVKKYTAPATPVDITFRIKSNGSDTAYADSMIIFMMRLDADLTENTDYWYNEDDDEGSPTSLNGTYADFAKLTMTGIDNSQSYLVLACCHYNVNTVQDSMGFRFNSDAPVNNTPENSIEGEDTNEILLTGLVKVWDPTSSTWNLKSQAAVLRGSSGYEHRFSSIFVLDLSVFDQSWDDYNGGGLSRATTEWALLDGPNFTPNQAEDWVIFGFVQQEVVGANDWTKVEFEDLANNTTPDGCFGASWVDSYDSNDRAPAMIVWVDSLPASLEDYTLKGQSEGSSGSWTQRSIAGFSEELANGAPPAGQPTQIRTQGVPTGSGYRARPGAWN
jgi:hypothetical protein